VRVPCPARADTCYPYGDPRIIAGTGTCALELAQDAGPLDTVVVPVGGGACCRARRSRCGRYRPRRRIVGVELEASPDVQQSLLAGRRVTVPISPSIAEGQLLDTPGGATFGVIASLVDEIVTVADAEILDAVRLLFERAKLVVEPSGGSAVAAVLAGRLRGDPLGIVLSGLNISAERFAELIGP